MPIGNKLNCVEKAEINVLKANTIMTNRQIAKIVNRSESVVRKYLKDPVGYGQESSSGRSSKITKRQKQILIRSACNPRNLLGNCVKKQGWISLLEESVKF